MELTKALFASWRNGADGFLKWLEDVRPHVPGPSGKFVPFQPEPFQMEHVRAALAQGDDGSLKYGTLAFSYPRRHSKTTLCALLVLWRFTTMQGENIVCLANSEKQVVGVNFGLVRRIVLNTPFLKEFIGTQNIYAQKIELEAFNNTITASPMNAAALYGQKITCGWCSEIHAAHSDEAMQVLSSSLGDSMNSWLLVDSTVDGVGGPLHRLEQLHESGEDPTVYCALVRYRDLAEALERSPRWIRRSWLESRAKQLLPQVFASQHLNQRQESSNCLFSGSDVTTCMVRLPLPFTKADIQSYAQGRSFACGGALDRAYAFSLHGDSTIWTSVAKIATTHGECEYIVLNQQSIFGSLASGIKKAMMHDYKEYGLTNTCIESYNSQDIAVWAVENNIPTEIVHATNTAQQPAFLALHRVVKEGRLRFSDKMTDLAGEMKTFLYEIRKGQPFFGSDKFHDDRVYSLAWAIHSLRQRELAAYTLKNIMCNSKSNHAHLCYLRSGDVVLNCSDACKSHTQVLFMFQQYKSMRPETEFTLPIFYKSLVKVSGVRIVA